MGVSITKVVRQRIALFLEEGMAKIDISKLLDIPYSSVLKICKRYEKQGQAGLNRIWYSCYLEQTRLSTTEW